MKLTGLGFESWMANPGLGFGRLSLVVPGKFWGNGPALNYITTTFSQTISAHCAQSFSHMVLGI
jgi:hypothetical protein